MRKAFFSIVGVLAIPALAASTPLRAQAVTGPVLATESQKIPQWQTDAGGKMEFDAASIRPSASEGHDSGNIDLDASDYFRYTGGVVTAAGLPVNYIIFAYKIADTSQYPSMQVQLPKWAQSEKFFVAARPAGKPTKDQVRVMMQSLLMDRFKLAVHIETRQLPAYALVLDKPGQLGPQLKPRPDDELCNVTSASDKRVPAVPSSAVARSCGLFFSRENGLMHMKVSSWTMDQIAGTLSSTAATMEGLDPLPILNKTGLNGRFDIDVGFVRTQPHPSQANDESAIPGSSFLEALKSQAGLRLIKQIGPVEVLVIDHIERPSEN